jgi:hypothetical protein
LQLPAVQNLLQQSHFAVAGFILIGLGTLFQLGGVVIRGHQEDEYNESSFRRKQIRAAWSLNIITFGAAVVALGGLVILFSQLRAFESEARIRLRSYLSIVATRTPLEIGKPIKVNVEVQAAGQTPALDVRGHGHTEVAPFP